MKLKRIWKSAAQESSLFAGSEAAVLDCGTTDFSLNGRMLKDILVHAKPLGHNQKRRNHNLGFGFIYYGVVRAIRPKHTVVIGSGYGFSVVCLALAIRDNGAGRLSFVDPAYSLIKDGPGKTVGGRGTWKDPETVTNHFRRFGVDDVVTHYRFRSDQFFPEYERLQLPPIDLAFIDGSHTYENVRYDFLEALRRSRKNTYFFLHDTNIYVREAIRNAGVKKWLDIIKKEDKAFEVVNFPFSSGVALIRIVDPSIWKRFQ
ncbi:MAG: class I SAM-dependent methyltransferase [Pseudomonadota bacterium]